VHGSRRFYSEAGTGAPERVGVRLGQVAVDFDDHFEPVAEPQTFHFTFDVRVVRQQTEAIPIDEHVEHRHDVREEPDPQLVAEPAEGQAHLVG
jgi:hypothetical protein